MKWLFTHQDSNMVIVTHQDSDMVVGVSADTPERLEADGAVDNLLKLLDHLFKYDTATELLSVQRNRFSRRKVQQLKIDLPDEIRSWLLLWNNTLTFRT